MSDGEAGRMTDPAPQLWSDSKYAFWPRQRQPGFISVSLHRSLDGQRIVNYIQWQSRELLQSAHQSPEFRKEWGHFDQLTDEIDPHLYEVAHVIDGSQ
jgi:heme-degrading monooxygenase HmoA